MIKKYYSVNLNRMVTVPPATTVCESCGTEHYVDEKCDSKTK